MCQTQMAAPRGVGALLAETGDLTVGRLSSASAWQEKNGGSVERALLSTGGITEEVLTGALSRVFGLPGVSSAKLATSDPGVVARLAAAERRRFRVLPFELSGKRLKVATCDPRDPVLRKNLVALTGFEVDFHVAPDPVLEDVIGSFERQAAGTAPSFAPDVRPAPPRAPAAPAAAPDDSISRRTPFPLVDLSCRHEKAVQLKLCPLCGDVL